MTFICVSERGPSGLHCVIMKPYQKRACVVNPSATEAGIFQHNYVNTTVAKALAHCIATPSEGRLNIMMPSYQYRDSHVADKTVSPTVLTLTGESPYLGKTVFLLIQGPAAMVLIVWDR